MGSPSARAKSTVAAQANTRPSTVRIERHGRYLMQSLTNFSKVVFVFIGCVSFFLFFPAELILGSCGSGRGEEPSEGSPPPDSRSVVMCTVYTSTVRILYSQALPNFHVDLRLTRNPNSILL